MKPSTTKQPSLAIRVIELVESARRNVAAVANVAQVYTNYEIGRQIVEEEQGGKHRADYGKRILIDLSNKLTARFGRGWSVDNLQRMRGFYLLYSQKEIYATPLRKLSDEAKSATVLRIFPEPADSVTTVGDIPKFALSWSHYLKLMRIDDPEERRFYEIEAAENKWSLKELQRQFDSALYQRLALSKDKTKVRDLAKRGQVIEKPEDLVKDPYIGELKHQDIGQMQMYVNHYDRKVKLPDENKTIGILLCADKDDAIVEMTLPEGDRQIFASKYRTILPSKAQLKALIMANGNPPTAQEQTP